MGPAILRVEREVNVSDWTQIVPALIACMELFAIFNRDAKF